ncbi:receptor-type tyrosine-protein phosphatase epsilon-like [Saccostrea echinata]|uniref:receptor-type tyrosine-protein phosphatase epsilon-like n=1 Tax=Saccostrea echinata TaxID=191078 RepID=UPI002A81B433|nr:receptor-type tyrosine-protein phosphatase epsilon-like [Saccostrea echinata]
MPLTVFHFGLLIVCTYGFENLAIGKSTWQSTTHDSTVPSRKAVDGSKSDLSYSGGQCSISKDGQRSVTWWVDLGTISSVYNIVIYYRTDGFVWNAANPYTERFLGFSLYLSDVSNKNRGHLCFHDTTYTKATIPAVANISCPVHGQFVIYYNERLANTVYPVGYSTNAFAELCEVEVYGCSDPRHYGLDCSLPCPTNCKQYCHIESGNCLACKPGYKGERCEQLGTYSPPPPPPHTKLNFRECGDRKFGEACSKDCGVCLDYQQCDHINGICPAGCDRGYVGTLCKDACLLGTFGQNCKENCSKNCAKTHRCDFKDGECEGGLCRNNKYGYNCAEECRKECLNNTCSPIDGTCELEQTQEESSIPLIAGSISGSLIAILVVIIVVVVVKRLRSEKSDSDARKANNNPLYTTQKFQTHFSSIDSPKPGENYVNIEIEKPVIVPKKSSEVDVDDDELKHSDNPYGDLYMNETTVPDIPLNQLESVIAEKRKNDDDGFQKEYFGLPYGEQHKCDAGKKEENIIKNRFKTTFPYDHSRVMLCTKPGSDYINANYIEGAEREREYIAAQGPKQNTVGDFWTMIWQENVSVIVMLTNLREGNKPKCAQYWPNPNKHINYGTVSVQMTEEKSFAFFVVRRLSVSHKQTRKSRMVTQYHYTSWPDHGTPEPLCLIGFLDHVTRTGTNQKKSPTVVHCSAGIGRTGTYIALDVLNQIGRKTGKVNVAEYVKKMRENRMNMVQTYEQYITIFLALNEIFKSPVNTMTIADFTKMAENIASDKPVNHSALRKDFQLLMKIRPAYTESDYKLANQSSRGLHSNAILPLDKYSLHLSSIVPRRGNFINAICVPSFVNSRGFIVTQYPSTEDAVDFLRLLNDHESDIVICMDPLNEIESSKAWLPSPSSYKSVPPFTVHCQSKSGTDVRNTTIHILQKNSEEEAHSVTILEPQICIKTSENSQNTFQLRSLVSEALNLKTENPITIFSSDGASLCGVFCAVYNVIQQINMEDRIDAFTAVRQLQVRRPEFCSKLDEYCLVVKTVYDYIQSSTENMYCNQLN